MGFCFFNNVAIAARWAQAELGARARRDRRLRRPPRQRDAGDLRRRRLDVFFASLHQWPFYPGTGGPEEQGTTTVNVPLHPGAGDEEVLAALAGDIEPAVQRFEPELVLVSAGFDAHLEDPISDTAVTTEGFHELARRCAALAPRVAAVLEGGYNLATLPRLVETALAGFEAEK